MSGDRGSQPKQLVIKIEPCDLAVGLSVITSEQMVRVVFSERRLWARMFVIEYGFWSRSDTMGALLAVVIRRRLRRKRHFGPTAK